MPHKISFLVLSSSGHEDGYSAKELMVHAPTVSGWRSPRFCLYPQEIILQLADRCRIRKLQLLAHQYMISTKIEFYVCESLPEYFTPHQSDWFRRLGYVSLSDNEKTGFKARELKSVHVDAVGQYLKLIFHKNYANRYNLYNQVALVAINIIGDPAEHSDLDSAVSPTREKLINQYLGLSLDDPLLDGSYVGIGKQFCNYHLLFWFLLLGVLKCVFNERKRLLLFTRRTRYVESALFQVGERLGRYEVEKRCAVEKEDYDLAKQKKQQMDDYRLKVYQQLELHNLLQLGLIPKPHELPLEPADYSGTPRQPKPAESPRQKAGKNAEKAPEPESQPQELPSPRAPPKPSQPKVQRHASPPAAPPPSQLPPRINIDALPYDERPLPALRKQQGEPLISASVELSPPEEEPVTTSRSGITGEPEPLTERALREASFAIEVFGEALVAAAYSKTWSYREDALLAVHKKLMGVPASTPKDDLKNMLRAAIFLVRKAIKDKVSSVFQASLKLLKMLVTQYVPKHKLGKVESTHCVERTLPNLIAKTGDSTTRLRIVAMNFIQEMALFKEVKPLQVIPAQLVQPLKPNTVNRLALSQVELLERLLKDLGTENSGFTVDNVMRFAAGALEHTASEVRDTAVRIVLEMYRRHRGVILDYLPPDDANTRRNILYKALFDGFAKIDGKPTEAELRAQKKAATEEAEKRKKEEIRILQEQLAALKEIQAEVQTGKEKEVETMKPAKTEDHGKKEPPTPVPEITDDAVTNYLDNLCIFCGDRDESFTEEGLDLHYWKHCPMLKRCEHCKQVVEIASLTDHLLTECDKKEAFGKCQRCSEAISKEELTEHVRAKTCNPAKSEKVANHCPLCHENFPPGEEAWKSHLMGRDGCKMNPRRMQVLQRTQLLQQGKAGGLTVTKAAATAAKGRSPTGGSKIPGPRAGLHKATSRTPARR
nr:PREDICTED: centrosomal protein of 104 kDa [Latimeria chalumnae]|eukprot:XP_014347345.1 PREDICTED: centrosomal protein of 104 kDa [Latimeria chalumnae]